MSQRPGLVIWSGGQTGVDRAALDAALQAGLKIGGWIPLGRRAEDGPISSSYAGLRETDSDDYARRTVLNVAESDATLVLPWGSATGGTLATIEAARQLAKPHLVVDLASPGGAAASRRIAEWIAGHTSSNKLVLNVAGPRASQAPESYARARQLLMEVFDALSR